MASPSFKFAGMNTLADPTGIDVFNGNSSEYGQCVDIVNYDLDDENDAIRREGSTLVLPTVATSGWSTGTVAYCVVDGRLNRFDGTALSVLDSNLAVGSACEFEKVNDVVVFSDGIITGVINGSTVVRVDNPSDWENVQDLLNWLADHAPNDPALWDGENSNSNFDVDAFKLATMAGTCLHFFNGALYFAINNFIFKTKTFDVEHMDIRYCVIAGFADPVTFINHVNGGLFVGTTTGAYFLPGNGIVVDEKGNITDAFEQRQVSQYGAFYGTDARVSAIMLPKSQAQGVLVLWACSQGIMAGMESGIVVNLSADKVTLPAPGEGHGHAVFRYDSTGKRQYMVTLESEVWVLNTMQLTHSRYLNYQFTGIFTIGSSQYGTHATGIYLLSGETDAHLDSADVEAYALTPSTDFGSDKVKWLPALTLKARCSGDMAIDYIVDEDLAEEDDIVVFDDKAKAHARRAHPPRGLKGTYWQFKIRNIDGARCTIASLDPVPVASKHRTA